MYISLLDEFLQRPLITYVCTKTGLQVTILKKRPKRRKSRGGDCQLYYPSHAILFKYYRACTARLAAGNSLGKAQGEHTHTCHNGPLRLLAGAKLLLHLLLLHLLLIIKRTLLCAYHTHYGSIKLRLLYCTCCTKRQTDSCIDSLSHINPFSSKSCTSTKDPWSK